LDRVRHGQRLENYETIRRRKDGTLRDVSLTVSPVLDEPGKVVAASKIARDITDRKRAEEALRNSRENLERTVVQRTAALQGLSSRLLLSQDEERRRISRELHDSVGQYLAHAKMTITAHAGDEWNRGGCGPSATDALRTPHSFYAT
jgi:signal transduction histidine kinase